MKVKDYMQYCYMFLECNPNDTETTIRENFLYKLNEAYAEREGSGAFFRQYFDCGDNDDLDETARLYKEIHHQKLEEKAISNDAELLCDSYLAIILSKKDSQLYENIIKGLIKRWDEEYHRFYTDDSDYNPYFALRFPREEENIQMREPEYITKEEYLNKLTNWYESASHHRFCCISSLAIIINFEKEMMAEHMCLKEYKKLKMPMGRIVKKDEDNIKLMKVKEYVAEMKRRRENISE